jgi:putative transcriptional regulator
MSKQAKSPALAAVHEMIEDAFAAGTVGKTTMREFDKMCLTEVLPL